MGFELVTIGGDAMDKAMVFGLDIPCAKASQRVAAQAIIIAAAPGYSAAQNNALAAACNTIRSYNVTVPGLPDRIFKNGFESF